VIDGCWMVEDTITQAFGNQANGRGTRERTVKIRVQVVCAVVSLCKV